MSTIIIAIGILFALAVPAAFYSYLPTIRLERARRELADREQKLTAINQKIEAFGAIDSFETLLAYLTRQKCNKSEVAETLKLSGDFNRLLWDRLYCYSVAKEWVKIDPEEQWTSHWGRHVLCQRTAWARDADDLSAAIFNIKATIQNLKTRQEKKLAKQKTKPEKRVRVEVPPPPHPSDKRTQLQNLRVKIADIDSRGEKLREERRKLEVQAQALEQDILDEHGQSTPNRTPAGVSTN